MTPHTFDTTTPPYSQLPGYTPVVQAQLTIAINLGSRADMTVSSAVGMPAYGDEEPPVAQIGPETGAHDAAQIDHLVSDTDEFTSVPSAAALPMTGAAAALPVQTHGAGNGHPTMVE